MVKSCREKLDASSLLPLILTIHVQSAGGGGGLSTPKRTVGPDGHPTPITQPCLLATTAADYLPQPLSLTNSQMASQLETTHNGQFKPSSSGRVQSTLSQTSTPEAGSTNGSQGETAEGTNVGGHSVSFPRKQSRKGIVIHNHLFQHFY